MRHITLITTGGTIEKTYDERSGELTNRRSIVGRMVRRLRLEDTKVSTLELMSKDSLHLTNLYTYTLINKSSKAIPIGSYFVMHSNSILQVELLI